MKAYREYKDSGLPWAPNIPKAWKIIPIKHAYHFQTGATPPTKINEFFEGDNIWANISDLSSKIVNDSFKHISDDALKVCSMSISPKGSLMFSFKLSVGIVAFCGCDMYTNEAIATFLKGKNDLNYLYYAGPYFIVKNSNENIYGAKLLNQDLINNAKIFLPPLPEQLAIASFLDAKTKPIDDIIAKREKQIELLEEMKSAIVSHAVTKGLNPNAKMKDSGIEWIKTEPQSWETRRIKNVITLLTDYDANGSFADIAKNVKVNMGEPYAWMVRATDLANKRYGIVDDNNYCNKETYDFLSKSSLEAGDILIAKRGDIGKSYEVPKCDCPMTLAPNTYLLKTNKKVIRNRFFHYFFMSDYGKKQLSINNKSTTIGAIYKDDVKNLKILLPPMDEQQAIASYLDTETSKIDTRIAKRRKQIELLQEYKQALITAAVTGKIDVRDYIS